MMSPLLILTLAIVISCLDAQRPPMGPGGPRPPPPPPFGSPMGPGWGHPPPPPPSKPSNPGTPSCPATTPEQNKRLVIEFYQAVFNQQDFSQIDRFMADNMIEHNPNERDGRDEFKKNIPVLLSQTPKGSLVIAQSAADGDLVWLHSKLPVFGKDFALADIFRIECGKIVEHWDVQQEMVPSTVNPHPYF